MKIAVLLLAPLYAMGVVVFTLWAYSHAPLLLPAATIVLVGLLCAKLALQVEAPAQPLRLITPSTTVRAACQVCGDRLFVNVVACMACETPHHADCFAYAGCCSTYGCGSRIAA